MSSLDEGWRAIPDWEKYEVHPSGLIRNAKGYILKGSRSGGGYKGKNGGVYLKVVLYDTPRIKHWLIHQIVMLVFGPPKPSPLYEIHHRDYNPINNAISNLEWLTHKENMNANLHP